ncbi:MAG: hypothetical protein J6T10_13435 [Methanobrevibacter sp.]|nr:hypothetical protein [Methanobrevibacter sp.]
MAKLSYAQLKTLVASIVTTAKISNDTFSVTRDNIVGLLDKVGKITTIDTVYTLDKLSMFDGEYLSFGKTIEEWQQDLIIPEDYDSTGANALSPHDPTYRPVFYSYTVGKKKIPTTIRNNNIERAVHFEEQFVSIVAMNTKRLEDSMAQYRYNVKREMIAKLISIASTEMSSTTTFVASTAYSVNALLRDNDTPTAYGIVVKAYSANDATNWADAVAKGYIIVLNLIQTISAPVDTTTGEAFIKQVKEDVEKANDSSEGNSLNGNSLGATPEDSLYLIVKQGVIPTLQVDTLAGAFNKQELAIPAKVVVVKDFGSDASGAYAVLLDGRGMRLHNTYNATRENANGDGDFLNIFRHTEDTAYISRNTFLKVYKAS